MKATEQCIAVLMLACLWEAAVDGLVGRHAAIIQSVVPLFILYVVACQAKAFSWRRPGPPRSGRVR